MMCLTDLADGLNVVRNREKYKTSSLLSHLSSGLEQLNAQLAEKPENRVNRRGSEQRVLF